jgi:2-acylglycerol O-acyltransferase 2
LRPLLISDAARSAVYMIRSQGPQTPPLTPGVRKSIVIPIYPASMSLNPEPADPVARKENHLPPKSYADAAEEALDQDDDESMDEAAINAIKESPPRKHVARISSDLRPLSDVYEARPLGEIFEEDEMSPAPGSPSLRHVSGRLEKDGIRKHYANAVDEPEAPSTPRSNGSRHGTPVFGNGGGVQVVTDKSSIESYQSAVESYSGVGSDESPRSPVRKAHKRVSSRSLHASAVKHAQSHSPSTNRRISGAKEEGDESMEANAVKHGHSHSPSGEWNRLNGATEGLLEKSEVTPTEHAQSHSPWTDGETNGAEKEHESRLMHMLPTPAEEKREEEAQEKPEQKHEVTSEEKVFVEKYTSRSGQALATVELGDDFDKSLEQRENKGITSEPEAPAKQSRPQSGELVSGRRAGAGWAQSAIRWAPLNVPVQRRLQTLMVLIHTLSIAGGLALFFLLCTIPLLWPILLPYLIYVLLSNAGTSGQLSHRSEWIRRSKIWSLFAGYFPARLHRTAELEPTRKYIFGYHPHGIISHGAFVAFATEALGFSQLFPGITNTLLTLDSNFRIPLYRDYALRLGLASVSRESCENILSKGGRNGEGMGRAITIVVGGARESLDAKPGSLKLVLKRRKGFVKLAIRAGADLVPVLAFGENDLYDQVDSTKHPYVHKAQLLVKKFMGFTVPLFHARGEHFLTLPLWLTVVQADITTRRLQLRCRHDALSPTRKRRSRKPNPRHAGQGA